MVNVVGYHEFVNTRASKGIVKDYGITRNGSVQEPPQDYKTVLDMARYDPIIATALDLTVDLITYNRYRFIGDNERKVKEATKLFNDVLDFDQVVDNLLYQLLIFGDAYLELRKGKRTKQVKELHALETTEMKIRYDKNGEIEGYEQHPLGSFGVVPFKKEEVLYFRLKSIGSSVYSETPFLPIVNSYQTKTYANYYLRELFQNVPPKVLYALENANRAERELFMQNLYRAKLNPGVDVVGFGKVTSEMLKLAVDSGLIDLLKHIRNEVLTVLRVPVHWLDTSTMPNRGTGENVIIPYETRIKKIQAKIASLINKELMPLLGFPNVEFKWNPVSLLDEKSVVEVAQALKSMNVDDDSIIEYLKEKGVQLPNDVRIKSPEEMGLPMMGDSEKGVSDPQIQKEGAPSRQRMNQKTEKMTSDLNKKGVSEAGKAKTEENRMKTRSALDFKEYPYVIGGI